MEMYSSEGNALKRHAHFGAGRSKRLHERKRCKTKSSTTAGANSIACCVKILKRTIFIAFMVQTQISGCLSCKDDQVTWRGNDKGMNDTCFDCIDCPDAMEPSIPCGTAAKYGTHLECLVCREGTYSNNYSKEQCMPCSLCSVGRIVTRNCSATKNTLCSPCTHGYYKDDVVLGCLPCSICCWDGRDRFENLCKAQGLPRHQQCSPRHEGGCQSLASTEKSHTGGNNKVFVTTVKKRSSQGRTTSSLGSSATQETFISGSAAKSDDNNNVSSTDPTPARELQQQQRTTVTHANKKAAQEGNLRKFGLAKNKKRVIMGSSFSTVILMLLAAIAKRKKIAHCLKWLKCCPKCRSKDAEFSKPTERSTLEDIKVPIPFEVTGVPLPLCQLKSASLGAYQSTWKRLDKQPEGTKKGDFRDVAEEFGFVQEDIWELEKEFKVSGSGSPSRQLLECLEATRPELTVVDFIKVLQKPNIDRDDIVDILKDYLCKRNEQTKVELSSLTVNFQLQESRF